MKYQKERLLVMKQLLKFNSMDWESKTKMLVHFNRDEYEEGTQIFLDNIDSVDDQGIDMFFTGVNLTTESLSKAADNHKIIAEKLKNAKTESFRTAMRMAAYQHLISELP